MLLNLFSFDKRWRPVWNVCKTEHMTRREYRDMVACSRGESRKNSHRVTMGSGTKACRPGILAIARLLACRPARLACRPARLVVRAIVLVARLRHSCRLQSSTRVACRHQFFAFDFRGSYTYGRLHMLFFPIILRATTKQSADLMSSYIP